ncbi:hypothetical protein [Simkania sp.]|uniref:hypothetical protein n=1 Tax=Simkania sp. TaxID=34094 RepID=UPI003B519FB1
MTTKMEGRTISNGDFEGLFPFFILLLVGLIRLLKAKKKKESTQSAPPPQRRPAQPAPAPSPPKRTSVPNPAQLRREVPVEPPEPAYNSLQVKRDEHFWRKEKKARVQTLVESTGNKRKMFLLSEILRTPHF